MGLVQIAGGVLGSIVFFLVIASVWNDRQADDIWFVRCISVYLGGVLGAVVWLFSSSLITALFRSDNPIGMLVVLFFCSVLWVLLLFSCGATMGFGSGG